MAAKHRGHHHRKATTVKPGGAAQRKALQAGAAASPTTTTLPPLPNFAADSARLRGIVTGKRHLTKKPVFRVRARPLALGVPKLTKSKKKTSPLPLAELLLIALAPFAFMGVYLLGTDYLRRREPRRRRVSLVITPTRNH